MDLPPAVAWLLSLLVLLLRPVASVALAKLPGMPGALPGPSAEILQLAVCQ